MEWNIVLHHLPTSIYIYIYVYIYKYIFEMTPDCIMRDTCNSIRSYARWIQHTRLQDCPIAALLTKKYMLILNHIKEQLNASHLHISWNILYIQTVYKCGAPNYFKSGFPIHWFPLYAAECSITPHQKPFWVSIDNTGKILPWSAELRAILSLVSIHRSGRFRCLITKR